MVGTDFWAYHITLNFITFHHKKQGIFGEIKLVIPTKREEKEGKNLWCILPFFKDAIVCCKGKNKGKKRVFILPAELLLRGKTVRFRENGKYVVFQ